ncbi:unnamed protein product [Meloidogyne enterolobii]|uniref:Uncharacterized protein n=1 Tax=Meloidogyne enterolobii TaxID=390850 RepID=A0ACB0ZP97_MELEN
MIGNMSKEDEKEDEAGFNIKVNGEILLFNESIIYTFMPLWMINRVSVCFVIIFETPML